ncbi:hypothetical protein [Candidatus Tisiphia endosymbiont of Parasteatoda lunata]|uniref:hypothetical protein n=1 Tax=Candidatus Tisiphia endosymbiont of Parasteatoda lunata TaxID=3066275 RepID=UPI00313B3FBC
MVHRETLTEVDIFSSSYPVQGVLKIARLLPLNCAVKLGPYWTRGVNKDEDAPFPLDRKVRPYIIVLANDPLPLVKVVEGDNNAPALVGVVGENNNALPPVEHVGVVGDILEG